MVQREEVLRNIVQTWTEWLDIWAEERMEPKMTMIFLDWLTYNLGAYLIFSS